MKHYSPTGRRNHGRPLKRLLDTWDRNGYTSGPNPWQIDDDDDDDDDTPFKQCLIHVYMPANTLYRDDDDDDDDDNNNNKVGVA